MAKGSTHLAIEAFAGGIVLTTSIMAKGGGHLPAFIRWEHLLVFGVGFVFSMFLLSPDLDLRKSSHSHRWGTVRFIWWPYHLLFRHRGVSHNIFFGTATRLVYLTVVVLVIGMVFAHLWTQYGPGGIQGSVPGGGADLLLHNFSLAVYFIVGCYIPNLIHVTVDLVS
ncbi:MAG: DUF2227 family putative metal-binding protein [Candidatus Sumerlaeia bacterium]|nr:DUF2227 family putative metal-binding protein [Candidatus Sumerlaeia bacterium]